MELILHFIWQSNSGNQIWEGGIPVKSKYIWRVESRPNSLGPMTPGMENRRASPFAVRVSVGTSLYRKQTFILL